MSNMRLRRNIKPPARLGDPETGTRTASLLQSMHQTREDNAEKGPEELAALPMPMNWNWRRRLKAQERRIVSAPVVDFDPNQRPAAFPSLPEPRPGNSGPVQTNQNNHLQGEITGNEANELEELGPQEWIPKGQIENYVASNSTLNPTYVRNMQIMAGPGDNDEEDLRQFEDSDLEEPMDASAVLNAKIDNPEWKDISPAMQVEIVVNVLQSNNNDWEYTFRQLEIGAEDQVKLKRYLDTRNQQIARENRQLEEMRKKQLAVLMEMDHSDIRKHPVPPQLVLEAQMKETIDSIVKDNQTNEDLLMCKAYQFLAAREYLHRRSLDRSLAGDWGNDIVVMRDPEENDWPPHQAFQWAEDLTLKRRRANANRARDASKGRATDASNMQNGNQGPLRDRGRDRPDSCTNQGQTEILARLSMGPGNRAEVSGWAVPAPEFPTTPIKGHPADSGTIETPSKTQVGPRTLRETKTISSLEHPDSPIARSGEFPWAPQVLEMLMNLPDPGVSQYRYNVETEKAFLEGQGLGRQEKAGRDADGAEVKRADGTSTEGQQNVQDEVGGTSTSDPAPAVNSAVNAASQSNGKKTTIVPPKVLGSFADQFFSPEPALATMADVLGIPWRYCTGPLNSDEDSPVISGDHSFASDEDAIPKSDKDAPAKSSEDAPAKSNEDAPAPVISNEDARTNSDAPASVNSSEDASIISNGDAPAKSDEDAMGLSD